LISDEALCGATRNWWLKKMNLNTNPADAEADTSKDVPPIRPVPPEEGSINPSLHRQIEALIPRLRRYARALTHDVVAADDLVQECLTRALGKIQLWQEGTDLRAWLFTILHNQHVTFARREARERGCIKLQSYCSSLSLPPDQAARVQVRDLDRAIAKLPEEQRSVILLVGLQGMRYDEAAAVAKLPVGTVRSRVARGRESLRVMTGFFPRRHSRGSHIEASLASGSRAQETSR
jgi:RNA polymerase sigma-70 factor (ECF subfamily)